MVMLKSQVPIRNLITSGQAARVFNPPCSAENIRRLARIGQLPVAAIIGRGQRLYERTDVETLARERPAFIRGPRGTEEA